MVLFLQSFQTLPILSLLGRLRVVDFVNRAGLRALGGNLYTSTPESGMPLELNPDDGINIKQGFVEASNVDVAEEAHQHDLCSTRI